MTKKTVGRVQKTSTSETTNGEKFGILLEDEDGNENWYNGWGSVPEGVTEGAKVQIPYEINESNGSLYRNIEDKDAVDILEEGSSSSSSASSSAKSESFDRQNAIKTAGQIFKGKGQLDAEELQQFKLLVEELDHYNKEGEWDNLDDIVAEELLESKGKDQESSQKEDQPAKEDSEAVEDEEPEPKESVEEEEASEEQEESEDLQEEMKEAIEQNEDGEDVIFGEEGEEVEEE